MGAYQVPATRITGLSASGTTDSTGTWNADVDLDSFVTVPAAATGVILSIVNADGSPRWTGAATSGKTARLYQLDQSIGSQRYEIVPLGPGNTIDLYCENATLANFDILGFVDWTFFDIDAGLPTIASTSGATSTVTAPAGVASGSTAMLMRSFIGGYMPVGESTLMTASVGTASVLVPLDASLQLQMNTTGAMEVLAYTDEGVEWVSPWLGSAESITADGTVYTGTSTHGSALFAMLQWNGYTTGAGFASRAQGETRPPFSTTNTWGRAQYPPLNGSGQYEYQAETGFANTVYVTAWLLPAASGGLAGRGPRSLAGGMGPALSGGMSA